MFIGRERELDALNRLYQSDKFEFAVIYGRRRVGKTALINAFIDKKNAIYLPYDKELPVNTIEQIVNQIFETP